MTLAHPAEVYKQDHVKHVLCRCSLYHTSFSVCSFPAPAARGYHFRPFQRKLCDAITPQRARLTITLKLTTIASSHKAHQLTFPTPTQPSIPTPTHKHSLTPAYSSVPFMSFHPPTGPSAPQANTGFASHQSPAVSPAPGQQGVGAAAAAQSKEKPSLTGVRIKQRKRQAQASAKFEPEGELVRDSCSARTVVGRFRARQEERESGLVR
jgi:hypothetical protein